MSINSSRELGTKLGEINQEQSDIRSNLSANEQDANIVLITTEAMKLIGSLVVTKKIYDDTSFIINHPVQGDIDSSTLYIDGGYLAGSDDIEVYSTTF